jgi:hypothetical protein
MQLNRVPKQNKTTTPVQFQGETAIDSSPANQAGQGITRPFSTVQTTSKSPLAYGVVVEGDSMEPLLRSGDRVVCDPNLELRHNDVAVVKLKDGRIYIKRFQRLGSEIRLESENPDWPPMHFEESEVEYAHPAWEMRRDMRNLRIDPIVGFPVVAPLVARSSQPDAEPWKQTAIEVGLPGFAGSLEFDQLSLYRYLAEFLRLNQSYILEKLCPKLKGDALVKVWEALCFARDYTGSRDQQHIRFPVEMESEIIPYLHSRKSQSTHDVGMIFAFVIYNNADLFFKTFYPGTPVFDLHLAETLAIAAALVDTVGGCETDNGNGKAWRHFVFESREKLIRFRAQNIIKHNENNPSKRRAGERSQSRSKRASRHTKSRM